MNAVVVIAHWISLLTRPRLKPTEPAECSELLLRCCANVDSSFLLTRLCSMVYELSASLPASPASLRNQAGEYETNRGGKESHDAASRSHFQTRA